MAALHQGDDVMKIIKFVALFATFFSASISAAIIDNGLFSKDTSTGLEWRDLTGTYGKSYDYISSQFGPGGEYQGLRYATLAEFNLFAEHFIGKPVGTIGNGSVEDAYAVAEMAQLMGAPGRHSTCWAYGHIQGITSTSPALGVQTTASLNSEYTSGRRLTSTYITSSVGSSNSSPYYGSYLVTYEAPIPAALFMFAPALLGFLSLRKKRKT